YPSMYINAQFKKLFAKYSSFSFYLLAVIDDKEEFFTRRKGLFNQPTNNKFQTANRAATADVINDKLNDETDWKQNDKTQEPGNRLILNSTYEKRLADIQRDIRQVWFMTFSDTTAVNTDIRHAAEPAVDLLVSHILPGRKRFLHTSPNWLQFSVYK
ncbi:unnamed protein product, partial [Didymodactylos carnosus]